LFLVLSVSITTFLLTPAIAAVAQSVYPPTDPTVGPANVPSQDVQVRGAAKSLAFTGSSDTVTTVLAAAGLVVFGAALIFLATRRRNTTPQQA
jgi:LPXTG-motif cell wall-anchored protein